MRSISQREEPHGFGECADYIFPDISVEEKETDDSVGGATGSCFAVRLAGDHSAAEGVSGALFQHAADDGLVSGPAQARTGRVWSGAQEVRWGPTSDSRSPKDVTPLEVKAVMQTTRYLQARRNWMPT